MCNRYANRVSYRQYVEEFSDTRLPLIIPGPERAPNLEPRDNIRPTERAEVLLPVEGGLELRTMRWGLIPWFHKKTLKEWKVLTTNARSETVETIASYKSAFARRRCLIPVSAFYEWTGDKSPKTKWQFNVPGSEFFCFAGIWDRAETADGEIESYALVTLPPSPEFEKYHDRPPLVLGRDDYTAWLDSPASAKVLFEKPKPFRLNVELAPSSPGPSGVARGGVISKSVHCHSVFSVAASRTRGGTLPLRDENAACNPVRIPNSHYQTPQVASSGLLFRRVS